MSPQGIGPRTERWLESAPSRDTPPSFESRHTPRADSGPKEMVVREDNLKFPPSMKWQRPMPESWKEGISQPLLEIPAQRPPHVRRTSDGGSQRQPSPVPRLLASDERLKPYHLDSDGSSDEDTDSDDLSGPSKPHSGEEIILTSELIALSQALVPRPPPGSPASFKSGSSFIDEDVQRPMVYRPKRFEYQPSPAQHGAIPILQPGRSSDLLGASPRPDAFHLGPDEKGNQIPPDAKWTKITRRLVSPEVLSQDGRRYEARPDFVAVLGVLSRAEIQSLASRTAVLRAARHRPTQVPHHPGPRQPYTPPLQSQPPPRGIPIPHHSSRSRRSPSRDYYSSSSGSDEQRHHATPSPRSILKNKHDAPNYTYAAPPPPSPRRAPEDRPHAPHPRPHHHTRKHNNNNNNRDREAPRKHSHSHSHSHSSHSHSHERHPPKDREKEKEKEKEVQKRGFKIGGRDLTAAGIGGAAVSLLSMLGEAAEAL